MNYKIEKEGQGYVVTWDAGRTKPQREDLAEALANEMNNQPTKITTFALKICCEQEFLHSE
jgi:hypothetical protein